MAKVKGPMMSLEAAGTFGGDVRFRRGRGGVHVYRGGAPGSVTKTAPSARQVVVRSRYQEINAGWRALGDDERKTWNEIGRAAPTKQSGWNAYLAANMRGVVTDAAASLQLEAGGALLLEDGAGVLLLEEPSE